jgi:uncharacterized protein (DUF58 family)
MLPIASRQAAFAFFACVAAISIGIGAASLPVTLLGVGSLLGLAWALSATIPLGARLRRSRVELSWWVGHARPGQMGAQVVAGAGFDVRCAVLNRSAQAVELHDLLPVLPEGVSVLEGAGTSVVVPPLMRAEIGFRLVARAASRVVIQGLAVTVPGPLSLFSAPLYFPSPLALKVLPRAAALPSRIDARTTELSVERAGVTRLRRRGAGTELYEIREHMPGDPFKSIAWKASARAGTLLVREVEREVQQTVHLVLDVSGTMRGGEPGERKLDHGVELCARLARDALERGDRVGLTTTDGRVLSHVPDDDGLSHMLRIYDALLDATEVVDADLTEIDDEGVVALVAHHVRRQDGLDVGTQAGVDLPRLVEHVERALQTEPARPPPLAGTPEHAVLRRFCRARGLALPYRTETRAFAKGPGLARALAQAAGSSRSPRTLIVVSDLEGVVDLEPVLRTLRMLRARQHHPVFVLPDPESLLRPSHSQLERDLARAFALLERQRLASIRASLGRLGVPVRMLGARDDGAPSLREQPPQAA